MSKTNFRMNHILTVCLFYMSPVTDSVAIMTGFPTIKAYLKVSKIQSFFCNFACNFPVKDSVLSGNFRVSG